MVWKVPVYNTVHKMLTNPAYAGAYAFGKTQGRTTIVANRARKTAGHHKPRADWAVLIRDHHPGYISWEQYERNQAMIAANTNMKSRMEPKAGRGGRALLTGLLRCRRCGRMLHVSYTGIRAAVLRYHCKGAHINHGESWCISFGGLRTDQAVAKEVLCAISGNAIEAALEAAEQICNQREEQRRSLDLELEQTRYEARLAARRYEAVDPENRLVIGELEIRWNAALQRAGQLEAKLQDFDCDFRSVPVPDKEVLLSLAQDLPVVWDLASTDMRLKQRIVRILIREIVADVDEKNKEIVLLLHWAGGRHSELRLKKNATGRHGRCTSLEAIEIIRQMASTFTDEQIATTLNRLGMRTGTGNTWNEIRVRSARHHHQFPACDSARANDSITLEETAIRLGVSPTTVRRMIAQKTLAATQVVACAPWQVPVDALSSKAVQEAVEAIKNRVRAPQTQIVDQQQTMFSEG